ncbi:MAG TPA: arylesterase [Steroidobacteraceae bacterium]
MFKAIGILLGLSCVLSNAPAAAAQATVPPVILIYGDSLSAGYGIRLESGWVSLLTQRLATEGYGFRIVNASISGETTEGGLARLPRALLTQHPGILVLELGANDGLRGLPVSAMRENLAQMIRLARAQHCRVLLIGIQMPANYGTRYTSEFADAYQQLAAEQHVPLAQLLPETVADKPALMQPDGLHPNEQAQPLLLDNVWPRLKPLLRGAPGDR